MMKTNQQIAIEVLMGKWGNGNDRRTRLAAAGYDYNAIQTIVTALVEDGAFPDQQLPAVTGTETMEVKFDTSKYNAIAITFTAPKEDGA